MELAQANALIHCLIADVEMICIQVSNRAMGQSHYISLYCVNRTLNGWQYSRTVAPISVIE